jgi:hypothetical protein
MRRYLFWSIFVAIVTNSVARKGWSRYQPDAIQGLVLATLGGALLGLLIAKYSDKSTGVSSAYLKLGCGILAGLILGIMMTSSQATFADNAIVVSGGGALGLLAGVARFFVTPRTTEHA